MDYASVRDEITTGSLVGDADAGWVGVVVRAEDLFTYYGRHAEADPEMAGRLLVVYEPPEAAHGWPPVRLLSRVLAGRPAMLRMVSEAPAPEALDGLLLALARHFLVPPGQVPGQLVADLLAPPVADFTPADGGELVTLIWQGMGYMLPPPHGPAAGQMTARHLLDPVWGPPQVTDIALENPVAVEG
jgi:hypothetical protein